jgi:hypothetical protein
MTGLVRVFAGVLAVAAVVVATALGFSRWSTEQQAATRRALDARATELTLRALAPGSPLACLDQVANATVEAACEKALFASPEMVAAAVAYVDARLTLLADGLALAAADRTYEASLERMRQAIENDRYGIVAHVLATRGCLSGECPVLKLLRDPRQVATNLRERTFDAQIVLHAAAWRGDTALAAVSSPAAVLAPGTTTGAPPPSGVPLGPKYDFPSAASIPPVSIMNAEPALPPNSDAAGAPRPPRRPATPSRDPQQAAGAAPSPAPPPSAAVPPAPPGTLANPR